MRVLILANNSNGLYKFRGELIKKLSNIGEVVAVTPANDNIENLESIGCRLIIIPIDRRGINPFKDISLILNYLEVLRSEKPDIVITYTIKPNIYGGFLCRVLKIPYEMNITGLGTAFQNNNILRMLVIKMYKIACKKVKVIFFENIENQQVFIDEGIINKEKTQLLNGAGVNLQQYSFQEYPQENITTNFLFIGRIMAEKGIEELFYSCEMLYNNGFSFHLDMVGECEEDYFLRIAEYSKAGWLTFHSFQNDVKPFIKNCHCFVLPSWHEGMANTNLECSAMGRPVITSNIHGCLEAVVEKESGFLCEPKNADSLYQQMKKFIELPYDKKVEMGKKAREHMEKVFDKNKVVEQTINRIFD